MQYETLKNVQAQKRAMIEEFEEAMEKLKSEMNVANQKPSEALKILIDNERNKNK